MPLLSLFAIIFADMPLSFTPFYYAADFRHFLRRFSLLFIFIIFFRFRATLRRHAALLRRFFFRFIRHATLRHAIAALRRLSLEPCCHAFHYFFMLMPRRFSPMPCRCCCPLRHCHTPLLIFFAYFGYATLHCCCRHMPFSRFSDAIAYAAAFARRR